METLRGAFEVNSSFTAVSINSATHHPSGGGKPGQQFTKVAFGKEGGNCKLGPRLQLVCLGEFHQPFVTTGGEEELEAVGAVKGGCKGGEDEEGDRGGHVLLTKQVQQTTLQSSGKQSLE